MELSLHSKRRCPTVVYHPRLPYLSEFAEGVVIVCIITEEGPSMAKGGHLPPIGAKLSIF